MRHPPAVAIQPSKLRSRRVVAQKCGCDTPVAVTGRMCGAAFSTAARPRCVEVSDELRGVLAAAPDWAPMRCIFVGWPSRPDVWRDAATPSRTALSPLIRAASRYVSVVVVADSRYGGLAEVERRLDADGLSGVANVSVMGVDMDDCWLRDTGPIFRTRICRSSGAASVHVVEAVSFDFNAWGGEAGGCYSNYARDRGVGRSLARATGLTCIRSNLVLEGGSISCDGMGTLITTEECLLYGNRNKGVPKEALHAAFAETLGVSTVIWLPFGVGRDEDTNGHVDNMCVFAGPGHVVLHWADAADDEDQHRRSLAALQVLQSARDASGERLVIHRVHAPRVPILRTTKEANGVIAEESGAVSAKQRGAGERLAASYVNFVFVGDAVLVPIFGACANDDERGLREVEDAIQCAQKQFGKRLTAIAVPAREFVLSGGGMHCMTVAQPLPR